MAKFNFNLGDVESNNSFSPLAEGEYEVVVSDSMIKETKAGNGTYLNVELMLSTNRKVYDMFNLTNPNPKAVEIGLGKLKSLALACGVNPDTMEDSEELHGKHCIAMLTVDGDYNRVKYYKPSKVQPANKPALEEAPF